MIIPVIRQKLGSMPDLNDASAASYSNPIVICCTGQEINHPRSGANFNSCSSQVK
jgi:hypothetical protein